MNPEEPAPPPAESREYPLPRRSWFYFLTWSLVRFISRHYLRLKVHGAHHVPDRAPLIIVSNHASNLDPPVVAVSLDRPIHFLAKEELFSIPLLGRAIRALNAHPIKRESFDRRALKEVSDTVKAGEGLLIFPEGTRTRDGELQEPKPGAAMIAARAGALIVPAYVDGTFQAMPRGVNFPRRRTVRVFFGPPLPRPSPDEAALRGRDALDSLSRRMMDAIAALRPADSSPAGPTNPQ